MIRGYGYTVAMSHSKVPQGLRTKQVSVGAQPKSEVTVARRCQGHPFQVLMQAFFGSVALGP